MDLEKTEQLARLLSESSCSELTVTEGASVIHIKKSSSAAPAVKQEPVNTDAPVRTKERLTEVVADVVGVFTYSDNFAAGDPVKEGQLLGQIKAFNIENDVTAACDGVIAELSSEDNSPVEYGQTIIKIKH